MPQVKVKLLRPLDGKREGTIRTFDAGDAERLAEFGAVKILGPAKTPKPRKRAAAPATPAKKPSSAQRRSRVRTDPVPPPPAT